MVGDSFVAGECLALGVRYSSNLLRLKCTQCELPLFKQICCVDKIRSELMIMWI